MNLNYEICKYLFLVVLSTTSFVMKSQQMNNTTNKNMDNIYNFEEVDIILEENVRSNYPSTCEGRSDSECAKMVVKVFVNMNQKSDALRNAGAPKGIYTTDYEIIVDETCNLYRYDATSELEPLKKEAVRTLSMLPNFFRGTVDGKPVKVRLTFSSAFNIYQ